MTDQATNNKYRIIKTNMPSQILISGGICPNDFSLQINKLEGERIVKCVNMHEELVDALEYVKEYFTSNPTRIWPDSSMGKSKMSLMIQQALSKIEK